MRFTAFCLLLFGLSGAANGQDSNPLSEALTKDAAISVLESDDELTRLLKLSHNASIEEFRAKHNYWLQGISSADDVFGAVDRLQELRKQVSTDADERQLLKQKILVAKRMENEAETITLTYGQGSLRRLGKVTAVAYRTAAQLKLAQLDVDNSTKDRTKP